jgi:membrane protein DedA with SNARE-associated domain
MPLDSIILLILHYRYWILFPLAAFEGPIVTFLAGTLAALGYFNIFSVYLLLLLGDIIPDISYYFFGRYGNRKTLISRYAAKIGIGEEHFDAIRKLWHKHPSTTMFFTKFAYGLSTPFLISAGIVGMSPWRFLRHSIPISLINVAVLLMLGYYFGNYFKLVSDTLHLMQIAVGGVAVLAIAHYFLTRYMRKKLLKEKEREESTD